MSHRYVQAPFKPWHQIRICLFALLLILMQFGIEVAQAAPPYHADTDQKRSKSSLPQRAHIRFLTGTDFFPFNNLSTEGRLTGYNIDLIRAICQELDIAHRCQIAAQPWDELIPALLNNETDALVAGIQPEREKRMTLSFTRPYLSLPARFITTKALAAKDTHFSPDNKNIGVITGTAHEALLRAYFPKAKIQAYTDDTLMYQDLKTDKIQLIFGDAMRLSMNSAISTCCQFIGGAYPAQHYLGAGMMIALRNNDTELRLAFNNALSALERKGILNDLYLRYFPLNFY